MHALSTLKRDDVKRLRLERAQATETAGKNQVDTGGRSSVVLIRQSKQWMITAPFPARGETIPIERMLSILDARSTVRYAATGLERYGLDKPQAVLTLEDQSFAFGAVNNMTREQYVLTRNGVYLVPLAYITALPRTADALLALRLFAADEAPERFELPDFTAEVRNGAWALSPDTPDSSPDERNAWADNWRNASATRAARSDKRVASQSITVGLKDGRSIALGILQREPELVLVRRDEGVEYHFFAETGKKLLARPGGPEPKNK
jgi:hypothetical protein